MVFDGGVYPTPPCEQSATGATRFEQAGTLVELGNLLLLADRTKEARETFERALPLAAHNGLPQAIENVARAIRAEDGSVARANAFILRLRKDGK